MSPRSSNLRRVRVSRCRWRRGGRAPAELQAMYSPLLALVNESAAAALRAGAVVEETDIAELRRMTAPGQDGVTREVLSHREWTSMRHLNAFVRSLGASARAIGRRC